MYAILLIDYCRDRISLLMYLLSLTTRGTLIVLLPLPLFISTYPIFYFDIPSVLEKYLCFLVKTYGLLKKYLCFLGTYTWQGTPYYFKRKTEIANCLILSTLTIFFVLSY